MYVLADERALCRAPSFFWSAASHHPFVLASVRHIFPSMAQESDAGSDVREESSRPLHEPCQPRPEGSSSAQAHYGDDDKSYMEQVIYSSDSDDDDSSNAKCSAQLEFDPPAQGTVKTERCSMAMRHKLTPQRILQGVGKTDALSPLRLPLFQLTDPVARQWRVRNHSRSNSGIASSLNRCYLLPRLRQRNRPNPEPGPKTRAAIRSGDSAGVDTGAGKSCESVSKSVSLITES